MGKKTVGSFIAGTLMLAAVLGSPRATAQHEHAAPAGKPAIEFSAELTALLSEEMLAIEQGIGTLMTAMAAGEWPRVAETAEKIEKSYILAQRLTAEQREELERALPPRFKSLDSVFHRAAGRLAKAARERDAELAVFHSYKLMEACVECHSAYASERFPGFAEGGVGHRHD